MALPSPELLHSKWYEDWLSDYLARAENRYFEFQVLSMGVGARVWPKDRAFKACGCRHFVDYCTHIWQTDPHNILIELRWDKRAVPYLVGYDAGGESVSFTTEYHVSPMGDLVCQSIKPSLSDS